MSLPTSRYRSRGLQSIVARQKGGPWRTVGLSEAFDLILGHLDELCELRQNAQFKLGQKADQPDVKSKIKAGRKSRKKLAETKPNKSPEAVDDLQSQLITGARVRS